MNYGINVRLAKEDFQQKELDLINNIFGLFTKNVYFSMNCEFEVESDKFINFSGISGSGKTIIKDEIKRQTIQEKPNVKILDFDDIENFEQYHDKTILELFNITNSQDELLRILSGFGLFEMRILSMKIGDLSQGQRTRLKYVWLFYNIDNEKENYILIDEFLTFVDDLSAISFAMSIRKYIENKNIKLFTFGVNLNLVGQFEDVSYILGNSTINIIIRDNIVDYVVENSPKYFNEIKIKENVERNNSTEMINDW
jgi:ABC-type ATPase with predicted acetyltransferase domain